MNDRDYDEQTEKLQAFGMTLAILAVGYLLLRGIGVL